MRKDRGKVIKLGTHKRSFEWFFPLHTMASSSLRLGVYLPKTSITIVSRMDKATDFKFGWYIHRVHPNKSPLKIVEKRKRGQNQGLPNFFLVTPIISGMGKAMNFKLCRASVKGGSADVRMSQRVKCGYGCGGTSVFYPSYTATPIGRPWNNSLRIRPAAAPPLLCTGILN